MGYYGKVYGRSHPEQQYEVRSQHFQPSEPPKAFHPSQLNVREVRKDVAVIPLHTLVTDSEVQIDVPTPLAACGIPDGTTHAVLDPPRRSSHTVRALPAGGGAGMLQRGNFSGGISFFRLVPDSPQTKVTLGKNRNLPLEKSGRAIFRDTNFWVPDPPPPPF